VRWIGERWPDKWATMMLSEGGVADRWASSDVWVKGITVGGSGSRVWPVKKRKDFGFLFKLFQSTKKRD
jgi:hypothetical protein